MLLIALFAAPLVGWSTMGLCWHLVETDLRGGPDLGVLLIGAATAMAFTAGYGALRRVSTSKLVIWPVAALLLTFAVSAAIVIPMSMNFGLDEGLGAPD
jgi:hypothetical protein